MHKSKEAIMGHLQEFGVSLDGAKSLMSLLEPDMFTKEMGLTLIAAINCSMADVNLLSSPWDELAVVVQAECGLTLDAEEVPGARLGLIPKWVHRVMRATEEAKEAKRAEPDKTSSLGADGSSSESQAPPLPDPPKSVPTELEVPAPKSSHDRELEELIASLDAQEEKVRVSRALLLMNNATRDDEAKKADLAEAIYRENHAKKLAEKESKRLLMCDLKKKIALAQSAEADLKSQNESAVAAADLARRKQTSISALMSSLREGFVTEEQPLQSASKKSKFDDRMETEDTMLARALAGGRTTKTVVVVPPPPPPPPPKDTGFSKGGSFLFFPCFSPLGF